jgi:pyruvate dehydrogenase E2 component (dihydrolipoamide acetyltransferase)
MSTEITMPKLSDTMEEGKILRWLKRPGDTVHHGDALAEVETDKADMVLEAFDDGVLDEIRLNEGESAAVGVVIAMLAKPGEARAASEAVRPAASAEPMPESGASRAPRAPVEAEVVHTGAPSAHAAGEEPEDLDVEPHEMGESNGAHAEAGAHGLRPVRPLGEDLVVAISRRAAHAPAVVAKAELSAVHAPGEGKHRASPLARRAAEEAAIDLDHVRGTGPDGRITKRDVDTFVREQQMQRQRRIVAPREGLPGTREELSKMRRTIAQRMAASKREIPHFYVTAEVDMEEAVRFKKSLEATELFDEDITYNDIILKACALALARYPRMNAHYENDAINIYPDVNIGMAVAVEDGLIVPVLKHCQTLALPEITRAAHRLITKAVAQSGFTTEELSGATFTISNMGMLGVEHFSAVIVPRQAAILAVSAIRDRPVVREGHIVVGKTMMITVSCDHRIIDGVVAGRFLQELKRFLENPASLLV